MDSINREQTEHNRNDLSGPAAADKIREIIEKAENGFFCTVSAEGQLQARPMNVRQVDSDGNLWFLSAVDSNKNHELQKNATVALFFQGSKHSDFLQLGGRATVSTDKAKIKELWEPVLQTWFTDGIDDPRITAIKVEPTEGYYWDAKHGPLVAGV